MSTDLAAQARRERALREATKMARELITQALDWQAAHPTASIEELEGEVLALRQQFGQHLAESLLKHREAARPIPGPCCAECGAELRYKGQKTRRVPTTLGPLALERGHYRCAACQRSVFPPGSGVGVNASRLESPTAPAGDLGRCGRLLREDQ